MSLECLHDEPFDAVVVPIVKLRNPGVETLFRRHITSSQHPRWDVSEDFLVFSQLAPKSIRLSFIFQQLRLLW